MACWKAFTAAEVLGPARPGVRASRAPCPDLWPFSSRCTGVMVVAPRRRRDGNARSCRR
jgi:hypothetical protein